MQREVAGGEHVERPNVAIRLEPQRPSSHLDGARDVVEVTVLAKSLQILAGKDSPRNLIVGIDANLRFVKGDGGVTLPVVGRNGNGRRARRRAVRDGYQPRRPDGDCRREGGNRSRCSHDQSGAWMYGNVFVFDLS